MGMSGWMAFFGWMTLINIIIYAVGAIALLAMRGFVTRMHSKLMGVKEEHLPRLYFDYLGRYKILIIVFNLVPYLALLFMR